MILEAYHTQGRRDKILNFPRIATGNEQWLGDGFYFWQDYEFASWWGREKKCPKGKYPSSYDIYSANIEIDKDNFIDTVFNEEDYYEFVKKVEEFAKKFAKKFKKKPNLGEFNDFIADFDLWKEVEVIRFQDVPANNALIEVTDFFYKKRIQIRVNNPERISNFAHSKNLFCV